MTGHQRGPKQKLHVPSAFTTMHVICVFIVECVIAHFLPNHSLNELIWCAGSNYVYYYL